MLDATSTLMDSSPIDSQEGQTFLLIRLPKESVERANNGRVKVGSLYMYPDGRTEFQDNHTSKIYTLITRPDESDLLQISPQRSLALHLGKIDRSTLCLAPDYSY